MTGFPRTNSIIPDSAASSSSPSRSNMDNVSGRNASIVIEPPVQMKRVSKTYGRPKPDINFGDGSFDDSGSRARILKTAPRNADDQVIPESDDVDERVPSFDGFDWRAKLKAIDEEYDDIKPINNTVNASTMPHEDAVMVSQSGEEADISPFTALCGDSLLALSQGSPRGSDGPSGPSAVPLSHGSRFDDDDGGYGELGSVPKVPLLSSRSVLTSPETSDSENLSSKNLYTIDFPENHSSPTPPTSPFIEEPVPERTFVTEGGCGGSKHSKVARASKTGETKDKGKGNMKRSKVRTLTLRMSTLQTPDEAPTKREVQEIQKESARLLADQHVSIRRSQTRPVHTIVNLFNKLKKVPTPLVRQDSDPIASFSSPGRPFMPFLNATFSNTSPVILDQFGKVGSSSKAQTTVSPSQVRLPSENAEKIVKNGFHEDIPDPDLLLRDHDEERRRRVRDQAEYTEAARRVRELQDRKQKALELSKPQFTSKTTASKADVKLEAHSDSDDLEIVEDMVTLPAPSRSHIGRSMKALIHRSHATVGLSRVSEEISARFKTVSRKDLELAARPNFISAQDKKGSKQKQDIFVSHQDLNNVMLQRADKQHSAIEEKKKELWIKAGGTPMRQHPSNVPEKSVTDWLDKGSFREDLMEVDGDIGDPEYTPEEVEEVGDRAIDKSDDESDAPDDEIVSRRGMGISEEELDNHTDTDKENLRPTRRQSARVIVDSDEENDFAKHLSSSRPTAVVLVPDTSFAHDDAESPSEDKENSAELAFDRGEDKENARVPRHLPRGRVLNTDELSPSIFRDGDVVEDGREPLTSLDIERGNIFMPSPAQRLDSSRGRILQVLHEEERNPSLSPITLPERGLLGRRTLSASPGSDNDYIERPKPILGAGFTQLFSGSDHDEPGPATAIGQGSFSQFFSANEPACESTFAIKRDQKPFRHRLEPTAQDGDFQFTQPVTLLPSVRISESQRREVDEMFGKDQEFKLDEARRSRAEAKLSKTSIPVFSDFQAFSPSKPSPLSSHSIRRPLETLSLDSGDAISHLGGSSEITPFRSGRLLRERPSGLQISPSPSPVPRNAFDVLRDAAAAAKVKERTSKPRLEKSDFIEAEAQESDEEAMIGFRGAKEDDDEDQGDEDPNSTVEGLLDDAVMDVQIEAADLVLEKHMEHQAADDAVLQKLHQDAADGKLRGKRRDRGLGFEDSDTDEEEYRGPRKPLYKKRRVEGDTLESYGKNPETKAFYDTYQADLVEDTDPRLAHLQQNDFDPTQDGSGSSDEEPKTIDSAEVRRRLKELTKSEISSEGKLDFQDLSWMENQDEDASDNLEVEERPFRRKKTAPEIPPSLDHFDYTGTFKGKKMDSDEQAKLKSWASQETRAHSSASGRGGFSRKDISSESLGKRRDDMSRSASGTGLGDRASTRSSSLMSRMGKRKGFDDCTRP